MARTHDDYTAASSDNVKYGWVKGPYPSEKTLATGTNLSHPTCNTCKHYVKLPLVDIVRCIRADDPIIVEADWYCKGHQHA